MRATIATATGPNRVYRRVMPDLPRNPWAMPALDGYSALFARAAGGPVRRSAAVAIRTGAALHPRRVGGSGAHFTAQQDTPAPPPRREGEPRQGAILRREGPLYSAP